MDLKLPQEEIHAAIGSIETSRKGELSNADNAEELVHEFFCCHGGRLERIVSTGQSSPVDFWYDQSEHEWVTIVQGNAVVNVDGEDIHMVAGDQLWIPAHTKHRVTSTSTKEQTTWMCFFFDPTSPAFTNVRTSYIGYPDCAGEESKHQCPDMRRHFSTQVHAAMKEWITAADNMMAAYHTDTVSALLLQALSSDGATPVQASPVCTSFLAVLQTLLSNGADSTVGQSPVKALKSLFLESNSTSRKKLLRLFDFCFLNPSFRHEEQNLPIISDMIRFVSVLYSVTLFNAVGGNADVVGTLSGQ